MAKSFLEEAENLIKELDFSKDKNSKLIDQVKVLRGIIDEKDTKIVALQKKAEELMRVIVAGDKEIQNLKGSIISRNEKIGKLPELQKAVVESRKNIEEQKAITEDVLAENLKLKEQIKSLEMKSGEHESKLNHMKRAIVEKNKAMIDYEKRIDGLTRQLVRGDKTLSELKENIVLRDEKIERLSGKFIETSENHKSLVDSANKNAEKSKEAVKNLLKEKQDAERKLAGLIGAHSKLKKEFENVLRLAKNQGKKLETLNREEEILGSYSEKIKEQQKII
ncbi:hypothetical protein KY308_03445, partial [Candidatus Woesearchaeota archaeon]|nr:hypothetical protein [Candidatus Woesearchaeota archaeon]